MRMPFEKLMEYVSAIAPEEREFPLGVFAEGWGEPAERIMDAIDAVRVLRGERTYITIGPFGPNGGDSLTITDRTSPAGREGNGEGGSA